MFSASPFGIIQADPPQWRPQEDRAASAFIGITLFLCVETLFEIFRAFKTRRGLYFWCLLIGVLGCFIDAIGVILKYLVPGSTDYWPLYTLMLMTGWTCSSLGQLLVLWSRLHLLIDNHRVQRWVLYMICACVFFFTIPTWIVVWPAYNPALTHRWSAPDAIVERINHIGFTLAECAISGVYLHALSRLLKYKPTVRQKRVFLDLVYVNVAIIVLDILTTVLIYLNQLGTSHPVQVMSYIIKFRLEFAVLNQLMAVAARGMRRDTFAERRYHDASMGESWYSGQKYPMSGVTKPIKDSAASGELASGDGTSGGDTPGDGTRGSVAPDSTRGETDISVPAATFEAALDKTRSQHYWGDDSAIPLQGHRNNSHDVSRQGGRGSARNGRRSAQDDDEDEIPLHMWERNGSIVLRVPWLATDRGGHI
ncbi:MAG: hypothetical protein Q9168_006585 [Polycauliona sp. 1 TL-2023]